MRIWAFIAASLCLAVQAGWEDQYTGLWFDPSNPGWGVSLHQQGQSINATLLLYGKDGDARYFEARDARLQDWDPYVLWDPVTFGGTLREPGLPSSRAVGTIVLSFRGRLAPRNAHARDRRGEDDEPGHARDVRKYRAGRSLRGQPHRDFVPPMRRALR
jgi:hypothetical protein